MRAIHPLAACAAAALVLTLTACTDASSPDGSGGGGGEAETTTSPFAPYREALYGGGSDAEAQQLKQLQFNAKVEERVVVCMKEQGFEYTAAEPDSESDRNLLSGKDNEEQEEYAWQPDDKDWVEKWGYGIVDYPGRAEFTEQAAEVEVEVDDAEGSGDEYYDSLSESQKAAYEEALHGPAIDKEAALADENYEYDWKEAGCYGKAQHELEGDDVATFDPTEYQDLMDRMSAVGDEIASDPKIAALDARWASCMDEAGEPGFAMQMDAADSINMAYEELYVAAMGTSDGEMAEGDMSAEPDLSPATNPQVAALQEREITVALADLECREKTSYQDMWDQITIDHEQAFVDANKAQLDAMKLALEQAEG